MAGKGLGQGFGQVLRVGAVLAGAVALTAAATAETIPLPTPAPLPKEGAAPQARQAQPSAPTGLLEGLSKLFNPDKQPEAPPAAAATTNPTAFDAKQRVQVDKVS